MLASLLAVTLCLAPGQEKTPPPAKTTPDKTAQGDKAAPGDKPAPAPEATAQDKETRDLVAKLRANLAFAKPPDNYLFREVKAGGRGGAGSVSERRYNGWYTKNYTRRPDGGETVSITNPDIRFTLEKPAGQAQWQIVEQGDLDKPFKDTILSSQKPQSTLPRHYFDMRYQVGRSAFIILAELTRHDDLVAYVTKEQQGGKTIYRYHLNAEGGQAYLDADPEMKWAVVKAWVKYDNGQEHEYLAEYSGLVFGSPALKRFQHRQRAGNGEFRTASDAEYTLVATTDVNPAEYTLEHYGVTPPERPWDVWTLGLIAWGGVTVLLVLWYLLARRKKPEAAAQPVPAS